MSERRRFRDRRHAGQILAARLGAYAGRSDVVVLALPRGGVPVAFEVARALGAVPTAAVETCEALRPLVDEIVCVSTPTPFLAVGLSYEDFGQTTDEEVLQLLASATDRAPAGTSA